MNEETEALRAEVATLRARVEAMSAEVRASAEQRGEVAAECAGLPIVPIGGGGGDAQGAFRYEDGKITNCHFMFGRNVISLADVAEAGDGYWKLVVPHDSPQSASVVEDSNGGQATGLAKTVIPLFIVYHGEVTVDFRGMPCVPVRE